MQTGHVTTPFGRRPVTLALVRQQMAVAEIKPGKVVNKWKVFRDASEARVLLRLQDRSLAVLDALLSFYPDNELKQDAQLVVFPSNQQLTLRAHGIAGATLRRHLALLVDAGLIVRRESANGKRYARKDKAGEIEAAFGFDLSPLLMRAEELALIAQDVVEADYLAIVRSIPRNPGLDELRVLLEDFDLMYEEVLNRLEIQNNSKEMSTNPAHNEQHIQSFKTECIHEFEPGSETEQEADLAPELKRRSEPLKAFPLAMVMKACPDIIDYGPGGSIASWRDLIKAAVVVRSMLGVSPSAYQEACEIMGPENAAVAMACILERAGHINSPGGYLRDLTRKAAKGEFGLGPMLMALLKVRADGGMMAA